jgi:nucleoporin p58/p45
MATPASKPGGLFGSVEKSSAPATGGLFGATAPAASAAPTGGLFGSTPAASKPGGLFGASTATPQPATGGLFGNTAAASTQPATGGLFGAKPAAAPTGGLFGQSQQAAQQAAPSSSLFGALNNANTSTLGQTQQSVPAVKIDWSNVKPTTRFNELHQEVQEAIVFIDSIIQGSMRASMQVSEAIPALGRQIDALPADVEYLDRRLETVEGALGRDAVAVGQNKEVIEKDSEDAIRLFRAVENLKLPNQFHYATIGSSNLDSTSAPDAGTTTDLLSYFSQRAIELEAQSKIFEKHQREVDQHLRTVEYSAVEGLRKLGRQQGSAEEGVGEGLREIAGVMRTFEEAILRVAERVGEGREGVVDLELGREGR